MMLGIRYICFNSDLVRLKVKLCGLPSSASCSFNSDLVRLKVTFEYDYSETDETFQFRFGAIKSLLQKN